MAAGNSGDAIISQTSFYGGMGTDRKIGIKNSYADAEAVDVRKNPSSMTVLPGSRKMFAEDLNGLIVAMTQTPDGVRWCLATNGEFYKISGFNELTLVTTLPNWEDGTHGDLEYWPLTDSIYITGVDRIYQYTPVLEAGAPAVKTLTGGHSTYPTMAQILVRDRDDKWIGGGTSRWSFKNGTGGTYTLPTAISEADSNRCIFLPDQSPMIAIDLRFRAKGAGNVTVTIHDQQNKLIATSTLAAAAISTTGTTRFTFPQTKLGEYKNFGTEYHLHVTATGTGFTVDSYEASQLYGLHFWYYSALLFDTYKKYHPIWNWAGSKLLIGNGQYLTDWLPSGLETLDSSEFQRHRVIVENGMEITSLTSNDEYVVLGCEKVGRTNARIFQSGMLGFWDGFADAINYKIDTPMGEPKSLYTYQNITYMMIEGVIYAYTGSKALAKIRTIQDSQSEYSNIEDRTDVYTHCMAVRRGILMIAYPSITTLKTMRHGIYSYGSVDKDYPNSFTYSYRVPQDDITNYDTDDYKIVIGGIWSFGDTMYYTYDVRFTNGSVSHGVAIVDNQSLPARNFKYESLVYDAGMPWKDKEIMRVGASFDPLPPSTRIRLMYKVDDRPWEIDTREATAGDFELYFEVNKRFREVQFGLVGTNDGSSRVTPRITSVGINVRELSEEGKMHK
ncbi:hypothetical protein CQ476_43 [TM7 phage DolZOral124_53_65]|nr:hypothetical protein CQ476_43 [TM7 phage DolZOral124_53_65]